LTSDTVIIQVSVPANALGTERSVRFHFSGYFRNNTGSNQTFTFKIKYGATTMVNCTSASIHSSAVYAAFDFSGTMANCGATNDQKVGGSMTYTRPTADPTNGYGGIGQLDTTFLAGAFRGSAAEYSTAAKTFYLYLSKSSSSVVMYVDQAILELV